MQTSLAQDRTGIPSMQPRSPELDLARETPPAGANLTVVGITVQGRPAANALVSNVAARYERPSVYKYIYIIIYDIYYNI